MTAAAVSSLQVIAKAIVLGRDDSFGHRTLPASLPHGIFRSSGIAVGDRAA